jgi:predicted RNase H-like HicB family nuclease
MRKEKVKNQFKVIIERDEDGFFVATVPALPGCHTQAKDMPELMRRMREAIKLCMDMAKESADYRRQIRQFSYEPAFVGMELITI